MVVANVALVSAASQAGQRFAMLVADRIQEGTMALALVGEVRSPADLMTVGARFWQQQAASMAAGIKLTGEFAIFASVVAFGVVAESVDRVAAATR